MSEEFKLAAEVKLKRRLKNLQRIDEKREIDQTFISCAEYQLFLDEMRTEHRFYQPDHWTTFRFPRGSALQPIVGVRAQDAEKFCEWLSQKEHKKYRCPTLTEAQEFFALENQEFATWCDENSLQWNSPRTKQQIEFKVENLLKGSWAVKYFRRDKFALARALDLARARALDDDLLKNFLKNQDFSAAQHRLQQLQSTNAVEQRKKSVLTELLNILITKNSVKQRQVWYKYVGYLAEDIVIYYEMLEYEMLEKEELSVWQRLLFWREVRNYAKEKETMAKLYAWTKVVEARQKGELPAWEGIRIVRESDV